MMQSVLAMTAALVYIYFHTAARRQTEQAAPSPPEIKEKFVSTMLALLRLLRQNALPMVMASLLCLPALLLFAQSPLHITFAYEEIGKFPSGWVSKNVREAQHIYTIQAENGHKFLHADASNVAVQMGYEHQWPLKDFPVLQWQWRADVFPEGSNEHEKKGNDSALAVYVIFGHWPFYKAIKYIWSETVARGQSFPSPSFRNARLVVLESGQSSRGSWVTESRNILSDYRELFGPADAMPDVKGIALLSDSDSTHTRAIGDYGDIQALPANGHNGTNGTDVQ
jgi:hypothetical protein